MAREASGNLHQELDSRLLLNKTMIFLLKGVFTRGCAFVVTLALDLCLLRRWLSLYPKRTR